MNDPDHINADKVVKSDVLIQHHKNSLGLQYQIKVGDSTFACSGYDEIKITIPVPSVVVKVERAWNNVSLVVNLVSLFTGSRAYLEPVYSDDYKTCVITVVRLVNASGERLIDIIAAEDKAKLISAMKKTRKECKYIHDPDKIGAQILDNFYRNHDSVSISVDNLQIIIEQFVDQEKKFLRKKAAEKAAKKARQKEELMRQQAEQEAKEKKEAKMLELQRKAFLNSINTAKDHFSRQIKSEFIEAGFLQHNTLSNGEKLKEYSALRKFCIKYVPELAEPGFRLETLPEKHPDFISEESCIKFKDNWVRMCHTYNILKKGASGEEKVAEVLRLFDDQIRILKNCTIDHYEHDFIVISHSGIYTIEVKNLYGQYELTETGILKCTTRGNTKSQDVALQSKKHLHTLRRCLTKCNVYSSDIPIREIICSAEPNFTITDNYHFLPVCYYNTLDKILLPNSGKAVLSAEEMEEIEKFLLDNQSEAYKYDVFLPYGEIDSYDLFIENLADILSGLHIAKEMQYQQFFGN